MLSENGDERKKRFKSADTIQIHCKSANTTKKKRRKNRRHDKRHDTKAKTLTISNTRHKNSKPHVMSNRLQLVSHVTRLHGVPQLGVII